MNPALETKDCLALLKATVVVAGDDIVFEKHSVVEALIVKLAAAAAAAGYAQGIISVEQVCAPNISYSTLVNVLQFIWSS